MTADLSPANRLMIALDYSDPSEAETLISKIGRGPIWKIGYQLAYSSGMSLARDLAADGYGVFLDLKLHDIPNTVEKGAAAAAALGADFLTVHAYPHTLAAAVAAKAGTHMKILGVTVLTSMNDDDLKAAGYAMNVSTLVSTRARQAKSAGADGVVCSAAEAGLVRDAAGAGLTLVTPGIRPAGADVGDQKRVVTPADAIARGADHIVVGRPITKSDDPKAAVAAILAEIKQAL